MSNQLWAVGGVVLGAVLGGGAQVVNAWLQDSRTSGRNLREERRRAYVGMVGTSMQAAMTISTLPATLSSNWRAEVRDPERATLRKHLADVQKAQAQVRLVGPADTGQAAEALWTATIAFMTKAEVDEDRVHSALDDFMKLAQRDLGLPGS